MGLMRGKMRVIVGKIEVNEGHGGDGFARVKGRGGHEASASALFLAAEAAASKREGDAGFGNSLRYKQDNN